MDAPEIRLVFPDTPELLAATREILREYAHSLNVDLCFQNFEAELASLPGDYAPPNGSLVLAFVDGALAGCGALRALPDTDYANACEMKRLFVRPAFRRFGLGRVIAQALLDEAQLIGFTDARLDALGSMEAARLLTSYSDFATAP